MLIVLLSQDCTQAGVLIFILILPCMQVEVLLFLDPKGLMVSVAVLVHLSRESCIGELTLET